MKDGGGRSALVVEEVVAGRRGEAGITTLAVQALFTDALEDGFHHVFLLWFAVITTISVRR